MGRAHFDRLSRMEDLRAASERARYAALEMLNIMETFPLFQYRPQSVEALHVKIEAQKLAYSDLQRYLADPRFSKVPVSGLLSKEYAKGRSALVDRDTARWVAESIRPWRARFLRWNPTPSTSTPSRS